MNRLVGLYLALFFLGACTQAQQTPKKAAGTGTGTTPTQTQTQQTQTQSGDDDDSSSGDDDDDDDSTTSTQTDPCSDSSSSGTNTNTDTNSSSSSDDDDDDSTLRSKKAGGAHKGGKRSSEKKNKRLQDDVTWSGQIKSIFENKCFKCHSSTGTDTDYSTYEKSKAVKSSIKSQVEDGDMPPEEESQLTNDEKTKILKWVEDGAPEGQSSDDDDDDDSTSTSGSGSGCGNTGTSGAQTLDEAFAELLGEKERQACNATGKLFKRGSNKGPAECVQSVAIATDFQCTRDGVVGKFKAVNINGADAIFDQRIGSGFTLDQCGVKDGKPVISFYKRVDNEGEVKLQTSFLCYGGSGLAFCSQ